MLTKQDWLENRVGYVFDGDAVYAQLLRASALRGRAQLLAFLEEWEPIAGDALDRAKQLTDGEWSVFVAGLEDRRQQKRSYAEAYGAILVPEVMLFVSLTANSFFAPWGTAWRRLIEVGRVALQGGRYAVVPDNGNKEGTR